MRLYDRYLALWDRHPTSRKIFVVGTGRSGTHWIGRVLDSHPAISATIEKPRIFSRVVDLATHLPANPRKLSGLVQRYRWEHSKVAPLNYVDKSHPNIWLVEDLARAFPNALFVGIRRNPYATVSSMLQHSGVRRWCEEWQKLPLPNQFLGIEEGQSDWYASLPLPSRCAVRWVSHSRRLDALKAAFPDSLQVVEYEDLFHDTAQILTNLQTFLNLAEPFPLPPIRTESMTKWETNLTAEDIGAIEQITGIPAPEVR